MSGFEDIVKKAFYMGVGMASYAQEKAGANIAEIKTKAQKLADEMIEKGEISVDEARKFVDDMVKQAQQSVVEPPKNERKKSEPRTIEIVADDEESESTKKTDNVEELKEQLNSLKEELNRLKKE